MTIAQTGDSTVKSVQIKIPSRSMGLKLIVVCGLALVMAIPALFVMGLVGERTRRAADVVQEISSLTGGPQTFLGPTLAIPSKIPPQSLGLPKRDTYFVFPAEASAVLKTVTEERHRSLFKVPVYHADVEFHATFDLTGLPNTTPEGLDLDWARAEMVVGVTDARGALSDATLTAGGPTLALVPAETSPNITLGGDPNGPIRLTLLGKRIDTFAQPNARFNVTCSLKFSGAQRVAVLSNGKTTRLSAQGDWPNPGFDGGFLPARREVTTHGFSADWFVPYIARGVSAEGPVASLAGLPATALGISLHRIGGPVSIREPIAQICAPLSRTGFPHLLRVRDFHRQTRAPRAIPSSRHRSNHFLSAAAIAVRADRIRLGLPHCGRGHRRSAFGQRGLGILPSVRSNTSRGDLHIVIYAHLSLAQNRRQCPAGRRHRKFPRRGRHHVPDSQNRLVRFACGNQLFQPAKQCPSSKT